MAGYDIEIYYQLENLLQNTTYWSFEISPSNGACL